jgi:hypothetical protein
MSVLRLARWARLATRLARFRVAPAAETDRAGGSLFVQKLAALQALDLSAHRGEPILVDVLDFGMARHQRPQEIIAKNEQQRQGKAAYGEDRNDRKDADKHAWASRKLRARVPCESTTEYGYARGFEKPSQRDMNYSRRAERHAGAIRAH